MPTRFAPPRLLSVCFSLVLLSFSASAVYGAPCVGTTWSDANGNWNVGGNWTPATVPNSTSTDVCITDTTSTVTLNGGFNPSIHNLTLAGGNTLNMNGTTLTVAGTQIVNNGAININGGAGANTTLALTNNVALSGTGTLTMNAIDTNGVTVLTGAGQTLSNSSTIQGAGQLGNGSSLAIINTGTINANSAGSVKSLTLNATGGVTNTGGLLTAANGGTLVITGTPINNIGGNITVADSTSAIVVANSTITGGTLNNTHAGGFLGTGDNSSSTLDGSTNGGLNAVTISTGSTYTAASGDNGSTNTTTLKGTITNQGNIALNGAGGSNGTLALSGTVTLNGGGTLTMKVADTNGFTAVTGAGATLNNVNNTIQGTGQLGNGSTLAIINTGTISANSTAGSIKSLTLNAQGGVTNTGGLLTAANGGTLVISGTTINNVGGNITVADNSSAVSINSSTVQGGTLNNTHAGGFLGTGDGTTSLLDGSTSAVTLSSGSTYTAATGHSGQSSATNLNGTINNQGNILVNGGGGGNGTLQLAGNVMLQGGGQVTMNRVDGNGVTNLQGSGFTLTNVDNTIHGTGVIGNGSLAVINGGTINADSAAGTVKSLTLNGTGGIVNSNGATAGLLAASNGGTLVISTTVNNAGANITVQDATSAVVVNGTTISGGTLNNKFGGFLGTNDNTTSTLDGSTNAVTLSSGSTYTAATGHTGQSSATNLNGTINNNGNILVNGGGGGNGTLQLAGNVMLQGGGQVTLNQVDNNGVARIQGNGFTLTNVDNTIHGTGTIGNGSLEVINGGTINADSAAGIKSLTLNGTGGIVNSNGATAGLLAASNGGTLVIATNVNNLGANITVQDATSAVVVNGTTISGGTLNNKFGGFLGTGDSTTTTLLDGSTNAVTLSSGSTYTAATGHTSTSAITNLNGTINNQGNILVNGGGGSNGTLNLAGNVMLQGGGQVTLNQVDTNGVARIQGNTFTLTNVDNTIHGTGTIGNGSLALINGGTINADSTAGTVKSLTLNGTGGIVNSNGATAGLLAASNGGTLVINTTVNNAGANITVQDATSAVLVSGTTISGGTLNNKFGGFLGTADSTTSLLDGSTSAVTLSSGSTYTAATGHTSTSTTTNLKGTINNQGNILVSGGGGGNGTLQLAGNVTLQGGGQVTMNHVDSNGVANLQGNTFTLTNVNNTIQGSGVIGNGSLVVTNQAGGFINGNSNGRTLSVNGSGLLTNAGTLGAAGGGALVVSSPFAGAAAGGFGNGGVGQLTGNYIVDGSAGHVSTLQINALGSTGGEVTVLGNGTLASSITLNGSGNGTTGNTLFFDSAGKNPLTNLGSVTANASLTVEGGYNMTAATTGLSSAGSVTIGSGSSITTGSNYTQTTGVTTVNGTLTSGAQVNILAGGTLQGTGSVSAPIGTRIQSGATLLPGAAGTPGTISFTGPLSIEGTGTLTETINGGTPGTGFGVTNVSTSITISAATPSYLNIQQSGAYNPPVGTALTIMTAGAAAVTGPSGLVPGAVFGSSLEQWNEVNNLGGNNVTLVAGTKNGADIISTSTGSGHWTTNGTWTTNVPTTFGTVPNNVTVNGLPFQFTAIVNSPSSTVALDSGTTQTIHNLTVTAGTLDVTANSTLNVTANSNIVDTLQVDGGSKLTTGTLTNYSGGTLTGGTYNLNGTGVIQSSSITAATGITTLAAGTNVTLSGATSAGNPSGFQNVSGGDALASLNTNNGSLTVTGGRTFIDTAAAGLTNTGSVTVGSAGVLTVNGAYSQSGGSTAISGAMFANTSYSQSGGTTTVNTSSGLHSNGNVTISGGTLQGTGSVSTGGTLTIATGGTLLPGAPGTPGTLSVLQQGVLGGNLAFTGGTLNEILNGTGAGTFGFTSVVGGINLGTTGTLDILQSGTFNPGIGTTITIASGASLSGSFATIDNAVFNSGTEKWVELNSGGNLELVAQSFSEITSTWTGPNGNWTNSANWNNSPSLTAFPNNGVNGNFAAVLNSTGNTMTLDGTSSPTSITVDSVNIQHGALLIAGAGTSLTTTGNFTNSGDLLQINTGATLNAGNLTNFSGGTLTGGQYNMNGGTLQSASFNGTGITSIANGTHVTLIGAGTTSGFLDSSSNDALRNLSSNNGVFVIGGRTITTATGSAFSNSGFLNVSTSGTLNIGTLGANNYSNTGTTFVTGGSLNAANYTDSSATHVFTGGVLTATGTLAESGAMTVDNGGKVLAGTYNNSGPTTVNGILTSTDYNDNSGGTTTIGNGGTLTATGTYTENGGFTDIAAGGTLTAGAVNLKAGKIQDDGTLDPMAPIDIFAGTEMFGTGTLIGDVTNNGEIFPGDDPTLGTLTINGTYHETSTGSLMEDIGGNNTTLGVLALTGTGNVTLDGGSTLDIGSLGFAPTFGQLFTILTFTGTETGMFTNVIGVDASDFTVLYNNSAHNIQLEWNQGGGGPPPSTPEPKFVLMDLALVGILVAWKSRRKKEISL